VATDILPDAVDSSRRYARAQGLEGRGAGRVHSELQDGRALTYPAASFDAAFAVSVVEHIPGDGDSIALRELLRVVRPGGLVIVTVPYDRRYRETFVTGPVYERAPVAAEPMFFERHYDRDTLLARLRPSDLCDVADLSVWGEGAIRMEALLDRLGPLRLPLSPFEALFSTALLRRVDGARGGHPMAAFLTLRRVLASGSESARTRAVD
jgi:SAM-dependent methyltransferase